jgi:hypothetical protein
LRRAFFSVASKIAGEDAFQVSGGAVT